MLKIIKKLIGVFNTAYVLIIQRIRAAFKSKDTEPVTKLDASSSKRQIVSELMNLRNELKPGQEHIQIQKFLDTPQGQKMKAEAVIQTSEHLLVPLIEKLNQTPNDQPGWRMMFSLAIMECSENIQKNEKILNSITQSKNNETF